MPASYIGIGSNLGDRRANIKAAIEKIKQLKNTQVTKVSSIIQTEPVGGPLQGKFLNAAIEINTDLTCLELLSCLQNIEFELGRLRTEKNAPRTIDLDILLFGRQKINESNLIVPHPRIKEREFVLRPLREIAPQVVSELLNENS